MSNWPILQEVFSSFSSRLKKPPLQVVMSSSSGGLVSSLSIGKGPPKSTGSWRLQNRFSPSQMGLHFPKDFSRPLRARNSIEGDRIQNDHLFLAYLGLAPKNGPLEDRRFWSICPFTNMVFLVSILFGKRVRNPEAKNQNPYAMSFPSHSFRLKNLPTSETLFPHMRLPLLGLCDQAQRRFAFQKIPCVQSFQKLPQKASEAWGLLASY